jgi:hypothetical protein
MSCCSTASRWDGGVANLQFYYKSVTLLGDRSGEGTHFVVI